MNALDKLDLSKEAHAAGIPEEALKNSARAIFWRLFNANTDHVLISVWGFHVTLGYIRGARALLIGPEVPPLIAAPPV